MAVRTVYMNVSTVHINWPIHMNMLLEATRFNFFHFSITVART
jgi:hypothetical protein